MPPVHPPVITRQTAVKIGGVERIVIIGREQVERVIHIKIEELAELTVTDGIDVKDLLAHNNSLLFVIIIPEITSAAVCATC